MPTCYLVGSPHMYNKLGLQREAPPPPPRTLAQQRSPNSRRSIVMSASSASPHAMRMGAQHMQPSPFGAMGHLKAQIIPSQPSPLEVA